VLATPAFHIYIQTYIHTYKHTYGSLYVWMYACILQPPRLYTTSTYIRHTYLHAYINISHIYIEHTYTYGCMFVCLYVCIVSMYLCIYHIWRGCAADAIAMPLTQPLGSAHCLVVSLRGVVSEKYKWLWL